MKKEMNPAQVRDLVRLLTVLRRLQEQLLTLVQSKIDAMRRADVPAMREVHAREQALVKQMQEREGFRRQLMDEIGRAMELPAGSARDLTVSQLAARLPQPDKTVLVETAEGLRGAILRVAQVNRIAGAVSRELVNHLQWVFASVSPKGDTPAAYSDDGRLVTPAETRVFEAVG